MTDRPEPLASKPSSALLSCALAGLLGAGAATACGSDPKHVADSSDDGGPVTPRGTGGDGAKGTGGSDAGAATPPDAGAGSTDAGTFSNVLSTTPIAFDAFSDLCVERGGFVTTNANCAGSNLCRGLSYMNDGDVLSEHSCEGMNSCEGMSCVDLPKDTGLTGAEIYETGPCSGCHDTAIEPPSNYILFVRPGTQVAEAKTQFENSSKQRLMNIVAFGTQGINESGTAFSNMPSYRKKYSRAEIERVVDYLRALDHPTKVYPIPGETPLDGGAHDPHDVNGDGGIAPDGG